MLECVALFSQSFTCWSGLVLQHVLFTPAKSCLKFGAGNQKICHVDGTQQKRVVNGGWATSQTWPPLSYAGMEKEINNMKFASK